jgi:hypothetical protein
MGDVGEARLEEELSCGEWSIRKGGHALSDNGAQLSSMWNATIQAVAASSFARGVPLRSDNQLVAAVASIYQALPPR